MGSQMLVLAILNTEQVTVIYSKYVLGLRVAYSAIHKANVRRTIGCSGGGGGRGRESEGLHSWLCTTPMK